MGNVPGAVLPLAKPVAGFAWEPWLASRPPPAPHTSIPENRYDTPLGYPSNRMIILSLDTIKKSSHGWRIVRP